MNRITVTVEGGLLPDDLLERIADGTAPGQHAVDFGVTSGRLSDEIMKAFSDAQSYWNAFRHRYERASKGGRESITTITRESFVVPLFEALGYGGSGYKLVFNKAALPAGDQVFVISHTAGEEAGAPPVNIIGADDKLDERGASRRSAHSSVQEYLNVSDCVWGIASNGHKLRLLRNSSRIAKPRYIEFDLAGMMESSVYSDFHLLYRLLHRTRLPHSASDASECWLEKYYLEGIEQGSRVRDRLRDGVVDALTIFGNAFLAHEKSDYLREQIAKGHLTAAAFYRELLRLVYRMLFLMVAEERRLMFPDSRENENRRAIFTEHYGVNRLRTRAESYIGDDPEIDLWESLKQAFRILRDDRAAHMMGMAALNGELFGPNGCPHLDGGGDDDRAALCRNDQLLRAIHALSTFDDDGVRRRVNFAALDVEELGSVYESLLEYHPQLSASPTSFDLVWGKERKTTGSYYTPPDLVRELIKSALIPVMEERLKLAKSKEDREHAILSMRVIDPAAGSGHFLLAASRQMGRQLARIRTGEEEPPPSAYRSAVRDVIRECIHAVDKNPLAVDLCKVALWIEGHNAGQPLSFLDHHVKCGDSLVGVFDLKVLEEGIPDDAYKAVEGDDNAAAKYYRKRNKDERESGQRPLAAQATDRQLADEYAELSHLDERTPDDVALKEERYKKLRERREMLYQRNACDAWTAAFFVAIQPPQFAGQDLVPTTGTVLTLQAGGQIYGKLLQAITKASETYSFFHWPAEFPDVFARGGFDVVLGNPPWERIKLQEKEFFASRDPEIARAVNKAARAKLIKELPKRKPELGHEWAIASHGAECHSKFVRASERFQLCGRGDVNTYSIFAELSRVLTGNTGRAGIIVPSGIATDDTTKFFFRDLIESGGLISLFSFFEIRKIFLATDSRNPFCLLTMCTAGQYREAEFVFSARSIAEIHHPDKRISLSADDIALLNPNTRTCPIFRTRRDAEITKAVYRRVPVLIKEGSLELNPWGIHCMTMFHLANDSHLFQTRDQLEADGWSTEGNVFFKDAFKCLPVYEAKMIHQFNHRFGDYRDKPQDSENTSLPDVPTSRLDSPKYQVMPRYWIGQNEVDQALGGKWDRQWLFGWRDICRSTDERTVIAGMLPRAGVGNTFPIILVGDLTFGLLGFQANLSAFILDYIARQKIGGTHLTYNYLNQIAVLPPQTYDTPAPWDLSCALDHWLGFRVLELVYTCEELAPLAYDFGYRGSPFHWSEQRRSLIRCELDAAFFNLYGISRDDTDYIMESFPIVKRKDEERFGEYRTKRVIVEIYDEMEQAKRTGRPYTTRLDPPPGDPRAAHNSRILNPDQPNAGK